MNEKNFLEIIQKIFHYLSFSAPILFVIVGIAFVYFAIYGVKDEEDKTKRIDFENPIDTNFAIGLNVVSILLSIFIGTLIILGIYWKIHEFDFTTASKHLLVSVGSMVSYIVIFIISVINIIYFIYVLKDVNYDKTKDVNIFLKPDTHIFVNVLAVLMSLLFSGFFIFSGLKVLVVSGEKKFGGGGGFGGFKGFKF